ARELLENGAIRRELKAVNEPKAPETDTPGLPDYSKRSLVESLVLTTHRFAVATDLELGDKQRGTYRKLTPEDRLGSRELVDSICRGMASHVDRHTVYMTGKEMIDMTSDMEGRYGGIGAPVNMIDGVCHIVKPIYKYMKLKDDGRSFEE